MSDEIYDNLDDETEKLINEYREIVCVHCGLKLFSGKEAIRHVKDDHPEIDIE